VAAPIGPGAAAEKHWHLSTRYFQGRVDFVMGEHWQLNESVGPVVGHSGPEAAGEKHQHLGAAYFRGRLDFARQLEVSKNELCDRP
jgi:hypothetical protein